jgi:deoxyribose-phosphate aldolase
VIELLDLTTLNETDTADDVRALCERAVTPKGAVAAVCILPAHVPTARQALQGTGVLVATVTNFPAGADDVELARRETADALAAGADEVDVVVPWHRGDPGAVFELVQACARELDGPGRLKAILETGSHPDLQTTRELAEAAIAAGAHFLKTSTGKVGPGASADAAEVLFDVVRLNGRGGVKVSGGVRTAAEAALYAGMARDALGELSPRTFRIGASSLLDALLAA